MTPAADSIALIRVIKHTYRISTTTHFDHRQQSFIWSLTASPPTAEAIPTNWPKLLISGAPQISSEITMQSFDLSSLSTNDSDSRLAIFIKIIAKLDNWSDSFRVSVERYLWIRRCHCRSVINGTGTRADPDDVTKLVNTSQDFLSTHVWCCWRFLVPCPSRLRTTISETWLILVPMGSCTLIPEPTLVLSLTLVIFTHTGDGTNTGPWIYTRFSADITVSKSILLNINFRNQLVLLTGHLRPWMQLPLPLLGLSLMTFTYLWNDYISGYTIDQATTWINFTILQWTYLLGELEGPLWQS